MQRNEKIFQNLKAEIDFYRETLIEVSRDIIDNEISNFPVFIAHEGTIAFGEKILDHNDFGKHWSINATHLDELIRVGLVTKEGEDHFKSAFKDPKEHFCILLISDRSAHFVFAPVTGASLN